MSVPDHINTKSRLYELWAIIAIALAVLSLIEVNKEATIIASLFFLFDPSFRSHKFRRIVILLLGVLTYFLGSPLICVVMIVWSYYRKTLWMGIIGSSLAIIGAFMHPQLTLITSFDAFSFHAGSLSFLLLTSLTITILSRQSSLIIRILILLWPVSLYFIILCAYEGGWWNQELITNHMGRVTLVIIPAFFNLLNRAEYRLIEINDTMNIRLIVIVSILSTLGTYVALPSRPISSIVFDESHGPWETVIKTYSPEDFGRAHNYSYSLLSDYAKELTGKSDYNLQNTGIVLPKDALFIIKTPTKLLESDFIEYMVNWVHDGGSLLVILDHTDLFDMTQNTNPLLQIIAGLKVNTDAVFDKNGLPNKPSTPISNRILGRLDANNKVFPYQTGASIQHLPWNARILASYGLSYSEPGDYSGTNRFGGFKTKPEYRFSEHPSIVAVPSGRGLVVLLTDSTLWSNFSIFLRPYKDLFRCLIVAFESPMAFHVMNIGLGLLICGTFLFIVFPTKIAKVIIIIIALSLGLIGGAGLKISREIWQDPTSGKDFGIRVALGSNVKLEFLPQLVGPGENNYSRAISSLSKYDLSPMAEIPGDEIPSLESASKWLIIEPNINGLPSVNSIQQAIQNNIDITILFSSHIVNNKDFTKWLAQLGFGIREISGNSLSEDLAPELLDRNGPILFKTKTIITHLYEPSLWKKLNVNMLAQSYGYPNSSGILTLGFNANQFSDSSMGNIWEGIEPSEIGRIREMQLASIVSNKQQELWPNDFDFYINDGKQQTLKHYLVIKNGINKASGEIDIKEDMFIVSNSKMPINKYLKKLLSSSTQFINKNYCQDYKIKGKCQNHMMGPYMTEWLVSYSKNIDDSFEHIELLHIETFSGNSGTYNIIFSK